MSKNGALFNTPINNVVNNDNSKVKNESKLEERYRNMENKSDNEIFGTSELPELDFDELKKTKFSGKSGMTEATSPIFKDNKLNETNTFKVKSSTTPNPGLSAETFYLPSKNLLYGENFDGHFNLRMFTTREERIRISNKDSFLQTMCSILNNCITTENGLEIDTKLFTEFDFIYTMYMARIVSYGNMYNVECICPEPTCYNRFKYKVNLDELKIHYLEDDFKEPIIIDELPYSKDKVELKYLRVIDRINMEKEAVEIKIEQPTYEGDPTYNLKFEYSIVSVNDKELTKLEKRDYVDNLPALDAQYINYILNRTDAGIDTDVDVVCPKCGNKHKIALSINSTFFRPGFND